MAKFKHQSTVFYFSSNEHGDITVKWQDASPGSKYRWDIIVRIGNKVHSWNARMSPTRTGALHLIYSSLEETKHAN